MDKPERKRLVGRPRSRLEDSIKIKKKQNGRMWAG
jgi:hypothetical protein